MPKKIAKLYEFAQKTGAPVIGLVDCAGMRLQEATDALNGFGQVYMAQAMASGVIPQITAIFGTCGGGMALIPALTDLYVYGRAKKENCLSIPRTHWMETFLPNATPRQRSSRARRQALWMLSAAKLTSWRRSASW